MNKKTNFNMSMLLNIGMTIIIIAVIIGIVLFALSGFTRDINEVCCSENNGQLVFWECYNNGFSDCSKYRTGYYCHFGNGTQIKVDELNCSIKNITNGES